MLRRHRGRTAPPTPTPPTPCSRFSLPRKGLCFVWRERASEREMQSFTKATTCSRAYLTWAHTHTGSSFLPRHIPEGPPAVEKRYASQLHLSRRIADSLFSYCRKRKKLFACLSSDENRVRLAVCSFAALIRPKLFWHREKRVF